MMLMKSHHLTGQSIATCTAVPLQEWGLTRELHHGVCKVLYLIDNMKIPVKLYHYFSKVSFLQLAVKHLVFPKRCSSVRESQDLH